VDEEPKDQYCTLREKGKGKKCCVRGFWSGRKKSPERRKQSERAFERRKRGWVLMISGEERRNFTVSEAESHCLAGAGEGKIVELVLLWG